MKSTLTKEGIKKALILMLCLIIALLSIFVVGKRATSPESYTKTIQAIDEKKITVMGLTTATAVTSTIIATIPGDATTPIANQIMDMTSYLLIIVCALVLEKSLLTVFGYLAFNIMIPSACAILAISVFWKHPILKIISLKIAVFALVIATVIPFSFKIGDLIYEVNKSTVEKLTAEVESMDDEEENDENLFNKIAKGAADLEEKAKNIVNSFIDAIAIFIIAYCAIPIVIFLVVIWFVKILFNITIPIPSKEQMKIMNRMKKKKTDVIPNDMYIEE